MDTQLEDHTYQNEFVVLVTGFAPFHATSPINPAAEIACRLPSEISPEKSLRVRIVVHPVPVVVAYKAVRELIPKLLEKETFDLVIHLGMTFDRSYYSIERRAHQYGYQAPDVDGMMCPDIKERVTRGKEWIWYGLPDEIVSEVDVDQVCSQWRNLSPGMDLRVSDNAGRYLCEFIYYSSLAHLSRQRRKRNVLFLHVPPNTDDSSLRTGVDVTIKLIEATILSEVEKRESSKAFSS